ncbi:MAG: hypothetical protein U0931_41190 [Vulcanimicrobiota bacterium]
MFQPVGVPMTGGFNPMLGGAPSFNPAFGGAMGPTMGGPGGCCGGGDPRMMMMMQLQIMEQMLNMMAMMMGGGGMGDMMGMPGMGGDMMGMPGMGGGMPNFGGFPGGGGMPGGFGGVPGGFGGAPGGFGGVPGGGFSPGGFGGVPGGGVTGPVQGGAAGQGGQAAVDYARRFLGRDSYTLKGQMNHFTAAGGKTNNCADFVSSALESTGQLRGHFVGVRALEGALQRQGYRRVPAQQAKPGDVWISNSRSHTELVTAPGGRKTIGSNNIRQGFQRISERDKNPGSGVYYSKG